MLPEGSDSESDKTPQGTPPMIPEETPAGTPPMIPEETPTGTPPMIPEETPEGTPPMLPEGSPGYDYGEEDEEEDLEPMKKLMRDGIDYDAFEVHRNLDS